jgi:hypothetical protein
MKDMTLEGLKDFILKRMLVAYLALIPSGLNAIILQSLLSIVIFSSNLILVLIGTWIMYRKFKEEKRMLEQEKLVEYSRRLDVFVEKFNDKIGHVGDSLSLLCIALEIARDRNVLESQAWAKYLTKLSEDLMIDGIGLRERIRVHEEQFKAHLSDFRRILDSLREFKKRFYEMLSDARHLISSYSGAEFKNRYEQASEEYNRYMDDLKTFSNEIKAKFGESLDEKLTGHIQGFDKLFQSEIRHPL